METLKLHYKSNSCELCEIGKKYDTDKSSQRNNVTNTRHCHPYTLFYHGRFKHVKNENLQIAELGILDGASLLMWKEYFNNATIDGFEYNYDLINHFKTKFNNDRINIYHIDVTQEDSIENSFFVSNKQYDIIIEDTTHQFEDQIRVIKNVYKYLKPGGILIIEDIFKHYDENQYINRLGDILDNFQDYYFIELDHNNRNSTNWNNDKLFILIKNGDGSQKHESIFKNKNKITIITPSCRPNNLLKLKESINFNYVNEWIIVYDGSKINTLPNLFENENKIKQYIHNSEGISGNPQRNFALSTITNDTFIYYLDDDNLIHPSLYKLINILDNKMYTFNQANGIKGDVIDINHIDTAMCIMDYKLCKNFTWRLDKYNADGYYLKECYENNINNYVYVNNDLCYYNKLLK